MNMKEIIEELNHHDYDCYEYGDEKPDCFYVQLDRRTLLSNHEVTLVCNMNNENINVQSGDEIAYGDWYDLWREELDKYQDELNEEIKLKAGIWFEG